MPGQEIITNLRTEDIESVLMREPTLLVACIRGTNYHEILEMIESVAIFFGPDLNVCYAREDLFPYFEKRFRVSGTPTFLLIKHGNILDSLLGTHSSQDLVTWISPFVRDLRRPVKSRIFLKCRRSLAGHQMAMSIISNPAVVA